MWMVTGASGFVGGHILTELRRGMTAEGIHRAELGAWDFDNLRRALEGAEGIVHAASVVHKPTTPVAEYARFNVETPIGVIDENTPHAADAPYSRTKAEAEDLVLAATDLRPAVLRLCPVYGRGDKGNVRTMIRAISRRRFVVPGDGSTKKSIVHVSTVASVVRAAAEQLATGVFVVADRRTPSIRELSDRIAHALGRRRPPSVPGPLLRGAASVIGGLARLARRDTAISSDLIAKAMRSSLCDPSRVERELGVSCTVDLDAALADEIAWLRELGEI